MSHPPTTPGQPEATSRKSDGDFRVNVTSTGYLDGFLDGFNAARNFLPEGRNQFKPGGAIRQSFPCPPLSDQPSFLHQLDLLASSVVAQGEPQNSPVSYPFLFPPTSEYDHRSDFPPGSANFSVGQRPSPGGTFATNNCESRSMRDEAAISCFNKSLPETSNPNFLTWPASADFESTVSVLAEPGFFTSHQDENSNIISNEELENVVNMTTSSNTSKRVPPHPLTQKRAPSPSAHMNKRTAADSPPDLSLLPNSRVANPCTDLPQTVLPKRGPPGATQLVFRAYGVKRTRLNERFRESTARTRELGAVSKPRKSLPLAGAAQERRPIFCTTSNHNEKLHYWMRSKEASKGRVLLQDGTAVIEPPRKVQLTHDVCTTTFEVTISRYQPGPEDTTGYSWTDSNGTRWTYELPPYYISDFAEAGANLRRYIRKAVAEFSKALLINSNPIVQKVFGEAERYYEESKSGLVAGALMLWSATRMIERFWLVTGNDLLGLPPMKQNIGPCRYNPYVKAVPVTPVMDTQLDEITIRHVLIPLKSKVMCLLKNKMLEKKKKNWYEIFLATFIILHNSEVVLSQVMDYSRRYGISFAPRSNDESSLSHAYYHACKTVLAYFHFASGGAIPLSLDWSNPDSGHSIMPQKQVEFLCEMKRELQTQGTFTRTPSTLVLLYLSPNIIKKPIYVT
ncbi:hypothetical protein O1611_g2985 [Lasiodiplodia mahajangana]|uniref:Uncharacterized protein n=1 Tax=Lasiodiplodia mahajangana TaxID=1108764 RepID=A0ACC2JT15_9PEZI|nr:hypothetical protein O1611_g2985 [Lasiodiplodia mahajangana]